MISRWHLIMIPLLSVSAISETNQTSRARSEFIVWNVGQGLWTTLSFGNECQHFDMGGEHAPWKVIRETCRGKLNPVNFSHWDADHINFALSAKSKLENLCVETSPAGPSNPAKIGSLEKIPTCPVGIQSASVDISIPPGDSISERNSNAFSRVFLVGTPVLKNEARILVPGDSTAKLERKWATESLTKKVWLLILGHHGSRTSNSDALISKLQRVSMAVASARMAKYGHPHREVSERLRRQGIAVLKTEDWGHLRFELPAATSPRALAPLQRRITDEEVYIPCSNCERRARKSRSHRKH